MLHIDFETRSRIDLLSMGIYRYAAHKSTEIICMGWAIGDEPAQLWLPHEPFPDRIRKHISAGGEIYAHNAQFERLIWRYKMPMELQPTLRQWRCTAFIARANNLPGDLEGCARALQVSHQKNMRGKSLIQQLCIPRSDGSFCRTPELLQEMYDYCLQDVRVERAILRRMRNPDAPEWEDYAISEQINDRGVKIDRPFAEIAADFAKEEAEELRAKVEKVTAGAVTKARGEGLKAWVYENIPAELRFHMEKGEKVVLDRAARQRLLAEEGIPLDVRTALEASDEVSNSSVSKYMAMLLRADPADDRVRGAFIPNGASASGRFSSRGLQLHNFPRDGFDDPQWVRDEIIEAWDESSYPAIEEPIMAILAKMLRPTLIPAQGHKFLVADWSAIEGRIAPWLEGSPLGEAKLDLYRDGLDVYSVGYASMNGIKPEDVTAEQRQIGKVAELALQYQGGHRAFQSMASNFGLRIRDDEATRIKEQWRAVNPWAERLWRLTESAAWNAIENPGTPYAAGRVRYVCVTKAITGDKTLFCILPDERILTYPDVRVGIEESPYGDRWVMTYLRSAFRPKVGEPGWPRSTLYGGLLTENITQGTAASVLRWALRRITHDIATPVAHVHDEIVLEVPDDDVTEVADQFARIMNSRPTWAGDLPIYAEVEIKSRYGK